MGPDVPTLEGAIVEESDSKELAKAGLKAQGARRAEALGAGFPFSHEMVLSMACKARVR